MLTELAANRATMNTAAKPACLWLFPGGHAGQSLPMARSFSSSAATQTRTAAFRQLLLHARPSRRHALDYSPGTATCYVIAADGTSHRYPATRAGS